MMLTIKVHLLPDAYTTEKLIAYGRAFKKEIFKVCTVFKKKHSSFDYRYKNISNDISWHSKGIVLDLAKDMYKANSQGKLLNLNFSSIWNYRSFEIDVDEKVLIFTLGKNHLEEKVIIPVYWTQYLEVRITDGDLKSMRLYVRDGKWTAYIYIDIKKEQSTLTKEMGIDLGIKVPAVVCTDNMQIRFFGNGKMIRYYQRSFRAKYQKLQSQGNHKKMVKMNHKLHHILNDIDHKISRMIIDFAEKEEVGVIKMEKLKYINKSFDIDILSNIYLWSYRRLQDLIEYKAALCGIRIEYVNPKNTSRICPSCGSINTPYDRQYQCSNCNYKQHRDIVGAINILRALSL